MLNRIYALAITALLFSQCKTIVLESETFSTTSAETRQIYAGVPTDTYTKQYSIEIYIHKSGYYYFDSAWINRDSAEILYETKTTDKKGMKLKNGQKIKLTIPILISFSRTVLLTPLEEKEKIFTFRYMRNGMVYYRTINYFIEKEPILNP